MGTVLRAVGRRVLGEGIRDEVRLRIPRTLAFYQRRMRPRITGERRHLKLADWIADGLALVAESGAEAVRIDHKGAWFEDPSGFQWVYQGHISGTGTWAEHGQEYEREETALMADLVSEGGTMIDVGVNVGLHAIKLARRVDGLRIIGFEPVGATIACLRLNLERNGVADRVEVRQVALGEHAGEIRMTTAMQITNFVVPDSTTAAAGATEIVPCRQLDDVVGKDLDRLDLVKCDVEGSELAVLRGARLTLERFAPPIFVEIVGRYTRRYGHEPGAVFKFLHDLGYRHELVVDGVRQPSTGSQQADLDSTPNFLFTR